MRALARRVRAGRQWNRLLAEPQCSLVQWALAAKPADGNGGPSRAGAGAAAMDSTAGGGAGSSEHACGLAEPPLLCVAQLRQAVLRQHLQELSAAAARPGASKLAYYLAWGRASCCRQKSTPPPWQRTWRRCGSVRGARHWRAYVATALPRRRCSFWKFISRKDLSNRSGVGAASASPSTHSTPPRREVPPAALLG